MARGLGHPDPGSRMNRGPFLFYSVESVNRKAGQCLAVPETVPVPSAWMLTLPCRHGLGEGGPCWVLRHRCHRCQEPQGTTWPTLSLERGRESWPGERLRPNTVFALHPALALLDLPWVRDICVSVSCLPTCYLSVSAKFQRANVLEAASGELGCALEVEGEAKGRREGQIAAFKSLEIQSRGEALTN